MKRLAMISKRFQRFQKDFKDKVEKERDYYDLKFLREVNSFGFLFKGIEPNYKILLWKLIIDQLLVVTDFFSKFSTDLHESMS